MTEKPPANGMSVTVKFPYGRKVHILDHMGNTLCGDEIKPNSVFSRWLFDKENVCDNCYKEIGRIMISEYLGADSLKNTVRRRKA